MAVINEENYHDEQNKNNILKLRKVLDTLPSFCRDFFRGIEPYTSTRTRLAYAYDIRLFFEFLHEKNSYCHKMEITEFPLSVLDMVQRTDIEEYLDYMSLYQKDGKNITNEERGKARKLAALRSFYNYYFQSERIEKNTAALVPLPKRHEKEIIRLEPNEVAILLDQVEDGTKLTKKELEYHKKTKLRDIALLTLLLGTGIRVSECVGLDINDVDFNNGGHPAQMLLGQTAGKDGHKPRPRDGQRAAGPRKQEHEHRQHDGEVHPEQNVPLPPCLPGCKCAGILAGLHGRERFHRNARHAARYDRNEQQRPPDIREVTVRQRRERKQEQQNRAHDCKRADARILENLLPRLKIAPR